MRNARVAALVAVLTVGSMVDATLALAQNAPAAPKRPNAQAPAPTRPPVAIVPPNSTATPAQPGTFDDKQKALVAKVSNYLSSVQTLVGDFVQIGPDGRRTEGQFYIQKPGKVRFEYNPPSPVEVIADGKSVVVRDPDTGDLTIADSATANQINAESQPIRRNKALRAMKNVVCPRFRVQARSSSIASP